MADIAVLVNTDVKFLIVHEHKHDDGIRNFFLDVWELWVKVSFMQLPALIVAWAKACLTFYCLFFRSSKIRFTISTRPSRRLLLIPRSRPAHANTYDARSNPSEFGDRFLPLTDMSTIKGREYEMKKLSGFASGCLVY